jgi:hypothetical protein
VSLRLFSLFSFLLVIYKEREEKEKETKRKNKSRRHTKAPITIPLVISK